VRAVVALGANLGEAAAAVRRAIDDLGRMPQTVLVKASSLYRSAPQEAQGPDYINAVACLQTQLPAPVLLDQLMALEQAAGRERPWHHAPRTLDLDLLLYGQARVHSPRLTVPHPRMWARAFVLLPLAEIFPDQVSDAQRAAVANQRVERI
jgi:2-amino-4-hydroxy-6-hydroxymethyldihydropteridine diphosphokinase